MKGLKRHTRGSPHSPASPARAAPAQQGPDGLYAPAPPLVPAPTRPTLAEKAKDEFASHFVDLVEEATTLRLTRSDVPETVAGIKALARARQWSEVLALAEGLLMAARDDQPHKRLQLSLVYTVACLKLRKYKAAVDHMAQLGDLHAVEHLAETYPDLYPGRKGTLAPFSLRVAAALMPRFNGQLDATIANLYILLHDIRSNRPDPAAVSSPPSAPPPSAEPRVVPEGDPLTSDPLMWPAPVTTDPLTEWRHKERMLVYILVDLHISPPLKQHPVAITLLRQLMASDPANPRIPEQMGRLCHQSGLTELSKRLFAKAAEMRPKEDISLDAHMERGIVLMAQAQYPEALDEFELVLEFNEGNVPAANNKSICLLHTGRLVDAIATLEELLISSPASVVCDSLVKNLCALYNLQNNNMAGKRQVLATVTKAVDPVFDLTILRLPS